MVRVALAVNPTSGRGRGASAGDRARHVLEDAGVAVEVLATPAARDATALRARARAALDAGVDALVVVGGDGMVNLGTDLVAGTGVPLGVVPAGTGNDVVRELGLPSAVDAAARHVADALARGGRRAVDAARITWDGGSRWFAGVLGAGFDAVVNERANGWSWPRGPRRYDLAILRELPLFRPRPYRLVLDGEVWTTRAMLVAVGNTPAYGGGMQVCAGARADDGLLDVVVVDPMPVPTFLRLYPKVYAGTHLADARVHVRRARTVVVDAPGIVGYADGERVAPLPLAVEAVPEALTLLA